MNFLGMELARLASLDHLGGIYERRGPVESDAVRFPGESVG
jgi:hypothetical protein